MAFQLNSKRIFVAGHNGMVGRALLKRLADENCEVLTVSSADLDLRRGGRTRKWMKANRPDAVIMAAATVGGINANRARPFDFLFDNVTMSASVISAAHHVGVEKLVYLGSSCIYPKFAEQPISEDALLTAELEPTNAPYAIAKIAGLKLVEGLRAQFGHDFVSAMPTNLYGPHDNFHPDDSHVIPGLLRRAHERKVAGERDLPIWGTGTPRREFLHVEDCADALITILKDYSDAAPINVGTGEDIQIKDLASLVMEIVDLPGEIQTDPTQPDGTPLKRLDIRKLTALGWSPQIVLKDGLTQTYAWFQDHLGTARL
jgi:GDP-L-fucose synthase